MLTVGKLRNLLEGLEDEGPVLVALVGPEDGQRMLAAVEGNPNDETISVKVLSALRAMDALASKDGRVVVFAFSQEG